MRKGLALVAAIAIGIGAYVALRGGPAAKPTDADPADPAAATSRAPSTPSLPAARVVPAELPPGVPTRAEANAIRTEPPPRPVPESTNLATPVVAAELDATHAALEERARTCAAGTAVDVAVKVVFRDGEAHVREAQATAAALAASTKQCIQDRLVGHRWTVSSPDKVFSMNVALRP